MANRLSCIFLAVYLSYSTLPAWAAQLTGIVEAGGLPLSDVVITATPLNKTAIRIHTKSQPESIALDQKSREFIPHVLAIRTGTPVFFPNSDDVRHHVYSFSQAKRFEIKLYSGTPKKPVLFNKPGLVALGCNIHDWMLGFVFVTDAPHFTKTDASGHWSLNLPEDDYQIELWHPDAAADFGGSKETLHVVLDQSLHHSIDLKSMRQNGKPPNTLQIQGYSDGF